MNFQQLSKQRQGEIFAISLTVLEAWFPIFALFSVAALGAIHAYFYSLVFATLALLLILKKQRKLQQMFDPAARADLLWVSFWMTTYYVLIFSSLQFTSANHVALIMFLQVLFGYIFLGRREGETISGKHLWGVVLMTLGAMIVLFPQDLKVNIGDLMALIAAVIAPIANLYQKRARAYVASETILTARSLIALPVLLLMMILMEPIQSFSEVFAVWYWLMLTGLLIFVLSKILWIESLHRLPINKVSALFAFSPLLTMLLSYLILNEVPTTSQILGGLPILIGGYLVTRKKENDPA